MGYFLSIIFGIDEKDPFFTYRGGNIATKVKYLLSMIHRNMVNIIVRFFILLLGIKYLYKTSIPILIKEGIPTVKDILIFPVVIVKFFIQTIINIFFALFGLIAGSDDEDYDEDDY